MKDKYFRMCAYISNWNIKMKDKIDKYFRRCTYFELEYASFSVSEEISSSMGSTKGSKTKMAPKYFGKTDLFKTVFDLLL